MYILCVCVGKTGAFCLPILQIVHETLTDIKCGKGQNTAASGTGMEINKWVLLLYINDRIEYHFQYQNGQCHFLIEAMLWLSVQMD